MILEGCANYKLNYSRSAKQWEEKLPEQNAEVTHTMYLIGDAGNGANPSLALLKQQLTGESERSSVLFLGDNIYPSGLPPKEEKAERDLAEKHLNTQLETLTNFKGLPLFIPGNHDWGKYGLKGLKRQEEYIEEYLNQGIENEDEWENYFLPDDGCGGPEVVEINDEIVVIIVDSNWWLRDWNLDPEINDDCEAKSRKVFAFLFEETLRKYRNKHVVVALHHPLFTNGPHGGNFTFKQHIFPFIDWRDNLYIPLPGIGTIAAFFRTTIGTKQDVAHQSYKNLKDALLGAAKKNGNFIFVSGHEHALQYFDNERQNFIVSGSGSNVSATKIGNGAAFAYGHLGYARIKFYNNGSAWVEYWVPENNEIEGKIVFRQKIKDELDISEDNTPASFPEYEAQKEAVEVFPITTEIEEKGGFHNFTMGKHYREIYTHPYTFPTLDLNTFKGGMTPIKPGGGNQTNSLRLKAPDGKEYNMRALTKDASRLLPYPFNRMKAAEDLAVENFLSTHPFAAIAIPPMADAVNVYHTNPALYYIPKQPALGEYNELFGGEVYLVEERPDEDWSDHASFGNSADIISTSKLAEELLESFDEQVDQPWAVRTRLFDLVIGDWDRHDDQWRWASLEYEEEGDKKTLYRPIPRDRDQAFSKYDGLLTGIARTTVAFPFLRQLRPYSPDIKNMKWSTWSARYFDRSFLNKLTWEDWEKEARYIQTHLTDEVIENAFKTWPEKAYELTAPKIIEIIKYRRDHLLDFARRHYLLVAKRVDVYGTDGRDRFEVERLDDARIKVSAYDLSSKGKTKEKVYDRILLQGETEEIAIYGLSDEDEFIVEGDVDKSILVRLIGGIDKDHFVDQSSVSGPAKMTKLYDNHEENLLETGKETKDLRSNRVNYNLYDRKEYHYEYNYMTPFPIVGYNPDYGFLLGADLFFTNYQFKKSPYAQTHRLKGTLAFATWSPELIYTGDFIDAVGNWDLLLNATLRGARFTRNFFGLGNDAENPADNKNFNRVRQSLIRIQPALKKRFAANSGNFLLGLSFERYKTEDTEGRFIDSDIPILSPTFFDPKYFAGAFTALNFDNVDDKRMTHRGLRFHTSLDWNLNLEETSRHFTTVKAELTFYTPLDHKENLIFASKAGTAKVWGDPEVYQLTSIGGTDNLRGFRFDRFYGNTSFYHNNDLRWRLFSSVNRIVPFTFGLMGGFDYGRVWLKGETSDTWHLGYGGGFWVAPIDYIVLSTGLYHSTDDDIVIFTLGFAF